MTPNLIAAASLRRIAAADFLNARPYGLARKNAVDELRFSIAESDSEWVSVEDEGTHTALLAAGGHYAVLYDTYFRQQSLEYVENVGRAAELADR